MTDHHVIIGGGQAGFQIASSLRKYGFEGRVTLICEEDRPPYERPPLSKAFLSGSASIDKLSLRKADFYQRKNIRLVVGDPARAIDPDKRTVRLRSGELIDYDRLALATGASPRRLNIPGADGENIFRLHAIEDSLSLGRALNEHRRVAIIGAGFIGLEVASIAAKKGCDVTVLEIADRPLSRLVSEDTASYFAKLHEEHGVRFEFESHVLAISSNGSARSVMSNRGETANAEVVVIGVGSSPNTALAQEADIRVSNGIEIDAAGQTSDPFIYAAGDCACVRNGASEQPIRLESVSAAVDQANAAARSMLSMPASRTPAPWFWTDQYDTRLQIAGVSRSEYASIRRVSDDQKSFTVLRVEGRILRAAETVNRLADFAAAKPLIENNAALDLVAAQDAARPLESCVI